MFYSNQSASLTLRIYGELCYSMFVHAFFSVQNSLLLIEQLVNASR